MMYAGDDGQPRRSFETNVDSLRVLFANAHENPTLDERSKGVPRAPLRSKLRKRPSYLESNMSVRTYMPM